MILKLTKQDHSELIEAERITTSRNENHSIEVAAYSKGNQIGRFVVMDDQNTSDVWECAYVLEHGKTCDTIRQTTRDPIS